MYDQDVGGRWWRHGPISLEFDEPGAERQAAQTPARNGHAGTDTSTYLLDDQPRPTANGGSVRYPSCDTDGGRPEHVLASEHESDGAEQRPVIAGTKPSSAPHPASADLAPPASHHPAASSSPDEASESASHLLDGVDAVQEPNETVKDRAKPDAVDTRAEGEGLGPRPAGPDASLETRACAGIEQDDAVPPDGTELSSHTEVDLQDQVDISAEDAEAETEAGCAKDERHGARQPEEHEAEPLGRERAHRAGIEGQRAVESNPQPRRGESDSWNSSSSANEAEFDRDEPEL